MRSRLIWSFAAIGIAVVAVSSFGFGPGVSTPHTSPGPATAGPAPSRWQPPAAMTWQIQFSGDPDYSVVAQAYDLDMFDTPASDVNLLHRTGRRAICYVNAGGWEDWRPDAEAFPEFVLGDALDGWPGERWLDVRRLDVLGPIMAARIKLCRAKGFDAVDFDNVDAYANETGLSVTADDQLAYNRWLAAQAHSLGLAVGLKNDLEQVQVLEPDFDFAINEQCVVYRECGLLQPFVRAGKAVLHIEYDIPLRAACLDAPRGFSTIKKRMNLDAWRRACTDPRVY